MSILALGSQPILKQKKRINEPKQAWDMVKIKFSPTQGGKCFGIKGTHIQIYQVAFLF